MDKPLDVFFTVTRQDVAMTKPVRLFALLLVSLVLGTLWQHPVQAAEVITLYDSTLHIFSDATLNVVESITVNVEGKRIQRGIYREFPTHYTDAAGRQIVVPFEVKSVTMDGHPEKYTVQSRSNGKQVRIGQKDVLISHGLHTYVITYTTGRQIGFFADHDELYWNVTGNGWNFPIEKAQATVTLPPAAHITAVTGYTGPQGSRAAKLQEKNLSPNTAFFITTAPLGRHENMTIAVRWQKGVVRQPSAVDEATWMFLDNADLYMLFAGVVIVFLSYIFMWRRVGRDPRSGTIVPLFAPPNGISPAAARFITRMGFDEKCLSVAIMDAAVKGCLKIRQNGKKDYTLEKQKEADDTLSHGEAAVMRALFSPGNDTVTLEQENAAVIDKARDALKTRLSQEYEKSFFFTNVGYFSAGLMMSLVFIGLALFFGGPSHAPTILITCTIIAAVVLVAMAIARRFFLFIVKSVASFFHTLFIVIFIIIISSILVKDAVALYWLISLPIAFLALINIVFYSLLKAPTVLGRKTMDQLAGFKMFLDIGEKERLATLYPPQMTPALFERFLPYAVALGVEQAWGDKFNNAMAEAGLEPGRYVPVWYVGSSWHDAADIGNFSSTLGNTLTSTITSSSTAPGTSSGFGSGFSGGSSGGGGGGGGGGGW